MTRLAVVHLITGLELGGAEHTLVRLVTSMDRERFSAVVISLLPEGPLVPRLRGTGIETVSLNMTPGRFSPGRASRLVGLLRHYRPDLLQTWLYHADLLGLIAARLAGVPAVAWNIRAANMDMSQYRPHSRWTRAACARLSRLPQAVVVNSETGRRHHQSLGYTPRAWIVIPNGVDVSAFRPDAAARRAVRAELRIPGEAPVIGLLARWDPMKDHETFLRAAAHLTTIRGDVHFVLAGDGASYDNPDFVSLCRRTAPGVRLVTLGRREDVPRIAAAMDVSTCSSITEGFPNAVIESMACAVPCVVTDVGDAATIVGETGLVVPPRAPESLADAWARLLALDARERAALGDCARARVIERYTLERMVAAYEALYDRLARSRDRPGS